MTGHRAKRPILQNRYDFPSGADAARKSEAAQLYTRLARRQLPTWRDRGRADQGRVRSARDGPRPARRA
jgi:hypothetical protein